MPRKSGGKKGKTVSAAEKAKVARRQATYQRLMRSGTRRFKKMRIAYNRVAGEPEGKALLQTHLQACNQRLKKVSAVVNSLDRKLNSYKPKTVQEKNLIKKMKTSAENYERQLIEEKKWLDEELERYKPKEKKREELVPKRLHEEVRDEWNPEQSYEENYKRIAKLLMVSENEVRHLATRMGLEVKKPRER